MYVVIFHAAGVRVRAFDDNCGIFLTEEDWSPDR